MTDPTISAATVYQGEVQFVSWNENGNGRKAVFTLDPLIGDVHPFKQIKPGRRLMLVAVLIGDDETPEAIPTGPKPRESSPGLVEAMPEAAVKSDKPPRPPFLTWPKSQQAGAMIRRLDFVEWMADDANIQSDPDKFLEVADYGNAVLKEKLGIVSKTELDTMPSKGDAWSALLTDFDNRDHLR